MEKENLQSDLLYLAKLIQNKSEFVDRALVVGMDGCGGSGKDTLAKKLAQLIPNLKVLSTDYLYSFKKKEKLSYLDYFDWPKLKKEVLQPIHAGVRTVIPTYNLFPPRQKIGSQEVKIGDIIIDTENGYKLSKGF